MHDESTGSLTAGDGDDVVPTMDTRALSVDDVWVEFGAALRTFVAGWPTPIRPRIWSARSSCGCIATSTRSTTRNGSPLGSSASPATWSRTRYKAAGRRREVLDPEPQPALSESGADEWVDDQAAVLSELAECLRPLLVELPDDYRRALELTDLGGLSQAEAAELEHVSLSGMKSRVQRGRRQLGAVLRQCCVPTLDSRGVPVDFRPRPDICGGSDVGGSGSHGDNRVSSIIDGGVA